jgi:hypothetical protein
MHPVLVGSSSNGLQQCLNKIFGAVAAGQEIPIVLHLIDCVVREREGMREEEYTVPGLYQHTTIMFLF